MNIDKKIYITTIFGAKRKIPIRAIVGKCKNKIHKGYVTDRELKKHKCYDCKTKEQCPFLVKNYYYRPLKKGTGDEKS